MEDNFYEGELNGLGDFNDVWDEVIRGWHQLLYKLEFWNFKEGQPKAKLNLILYGILRRVYKKCRKK